MKQVKLLDCTLRDGGYVNNWQFGRETIRDMLYRFAKSGADIVECGFLTDLPSKEGQALFHSVEEINALLPEGSSTLFVAMIAIGEKEINPSALSDAQKTGLGGVRLTFHPEEIDKAFCYGEVLKQKGYKLFMQPVGTASYSDEELICLIKRVNQLRPYAFYLVDTLGTMYGKLLLRQVILADHNLAEGIKIGYHSHNNLQMSFANAQKLLEYKTSRGLILDCSASGMGRGAGNLCTELVINYYNCEYESRYNVVPILEIVDKYISTISLTSRWGYSCPYFLSSIQNCHPNYASYLMSKQTMQVSAVSEILDQIPTEKREQFDKYLIERLYQKYQSHAVDDIEVIDMLRRKMSGRKVLLLAPGRSIVTCKEQIDQFIAQENPLVISINFVPESHSYDLLFLTNDRRYEEGGKEMDWKKVVATSNLRALPEGVTVVNYASLLNTSLYASDSACPMLLKLLVKCTVKDVYLAGMDGFSDDPLFNYWSPDYAVFNYDIPLHTKNEEINTQLNKRAKELRLTLLTPSLYKIHNQKDEDD
ncbi:MAG TPA: aldolase catalytic domain-containing protein [Candidatus Scatavimonas merdigallinarum]|uniref:Aldolase catalytic domain-containing protein n=1 Tax=Candidatus Scatavimonas merdigallinarum TaxID=2840914 RepID=A0A9D0ZJQ2_9FIRM|nr:aldolase catalytic domain-containing protein [Candidatus Scatavimonas merdigallinarum]